MLRHACSQHHLQVSGHLPIAHSSTLISLNTSQSRCKFYLTWSFGTFSDLSALFRILHKPIDEIVARSAAKLTEPSTSMFVHVAAAAHFADKQATGIVFPTSFFECFQVTRRSVRHADVKVRKRLENLYLFICSVKGDKIMSKIFHRWRYRSLLICTLNGKPLSACP